MAAAAVVVDSPANIDPHCPLYFLANEDVVTQTPCLDWEPAPADGAGNARVALSTFQAVKAFFARLRGSRGRPLQAFPRPR